MMNLLIVSNNDLCRSRMAQEILNSFGRGMKIDTAGVLPGNYIPDAVGCVMEQNGMSISRKKPCDVGVYLHQSWDYVITLCQEAEEEVRREMKGKAKHSARFYFDDIFHGLLLQLAALAIKHVLFGFGEFNHRVPLAQSSCVQWACFVPLF